MWLLFLYGNVEKMCLPAAICFSEDPAKLSAESGGPRRRANRFVCRSSFPSRKAAVRRFDCFVRIQIVHTAGGPWFYSRSTPCF